MAVTVEQLAEWYVRLKGLADAHHGHPTADRLKDLAQEVYESVPSEWWATQPEPLKN
ncbi:hypothetical protein EDD30_5650 [Couchioplanes caeruleus]|uniref:Uncharacterized protein n=1 Tax=Couchioplanes caeruleus TaxID=56438 RepID=A0A3N1GR51_9ACTN|nr:hypothetical protein EDD30_5650 [Couchioplanes caeruleus]